jgi:uncharacterized Zn finger protein
MFVAPFFFERRGEPNLKGGAVRRVMQYRPDLTASTDGSASKQVAITGEDGVFDDSKTPREAEFPQGGEVK